jgi:hypothetical protein
MNSSSQYQCLEAMMIFFCDQYGCFWPFAQLLSIMHETTGHDLGLISKGASGFCLSRVSTLLDSKYLDARNCKMALFRSTVGLSLNLTATIASLKTLVSSCLIGAYHYLWPTFHMIMGYDHGPNSWALRDFGNTTHSSFQVSYRYFLCISNLMPRVPLDRMTPTNLGLRDFDLLMNKFNNIMNSRIPC